MGSAMDDDASPFADDVDPAPSSGARAASAWKVLIVDDEPEVHDVTLLALRNDLQQACRQFAVRLLCDGVRPCLGRFRMVQTVQQARPHQERRKIARI